jgi:hypothetical protein
LIQNCESKDLLNASDLLGSGAEHLISERQGEEAQTTTQPPRQNRRRFSFSSSSSNSDQEQPKADATYEQLQREEEELAKERAEL